MLQAQVLELDEQLQSEMGSVQELELLIRKKREQNQKKSLQLQEWAKRNQQSTEQTEGEL